MSSRGPNFLKKKEKRSWYRKIRIHCLKRNADKTIITYDFLRNLAKRQNYKCYYTNLDMDFSTDQKNPYQPSLDRIDSTKPYSEKNCVLVTLAANYAKNDFSIEQFNNWMESIRKLNQLQ